MTKEIPAGTVNVPVNMPKALHLRYQQEADKDGLCVGDYILKCVAGFEKFSADAEAAEAMVQILVTERPKKAWLFGAGILGWINPRNILRPAGKAVGL